jgi:enamine deaminase RidA (YjgF/YER057c/UK114 family)
MCRGAVASLVLVAACMPGLAGAVETALERINPEGLAHSGRDSQIVTAGSGRLVFIAGQAGIGLDGSVPEDLGAQSRLMFEKLRVALDAVHAEPDDVARITVYVVDLDKIDPQPVFQAIRDFFPADARPASTIVGVSGLAVPGVKVEVDAIAVTEDGDSSTRGTYPARSM